MKLYLVGAKEENRLGFLHGTYPDVKVVGRKNATLYSKHAADILIRLMKDKHPLYSYTMFGDKLK